MTHRSPVSVVVPCYHAATTLARAIDSVACQTRPPIEVVLVDDASRDATPDVIRHLVERPWPFAVRAIHLSENRGPGEARNAGWASAAPLARYVAFLDADDLWLPGKLERQVGWMDRHAAIDWTAHRCGVLGRDLPPNRAGDTPSPRRLSRAGLLVRNAVATPTVVVRSEVATRFRPGWRWCEDLMLWIDWLDGGQAGVMLDESLALLGRPPTSSGGATGHRRAMFEGERRVIETLVREGRMSLLTAAGWRAFARVRYLRRLVTR